ncbi:adenylate/guanylate cyclase domain-containing protein [Streptomyces virginiae]
MTQSGQFRPIGRCVSVLASLGDRPQDTDEQQIQSHYLVFMGVSMVIAGAVWGALCALYGLWIPATFPFAYTILTALNFSHFRASKNFELTRFLQVLMSLLLPFLFQWSIGGFVASGAAMLWSMVALLGSLTFQNVRLGVAWLAAYLVLTVVSGLIDGSLQKFSPDIPRGVSTLFFVLNLGAVSTMVFGLTVYFLAKREEAKAKLGEMASVLKKMFGRYLSIEVMNSLIENPSALELGGERRTVTIMMTDLRGFTAISERLEPERVVQMLNAYFEVMLGHVLKYNGTINEIIGDGLLIIFGAPQEMPDRARRAIACAIEMQNAMSEVNIHNQSQGLPRLLMGIGLNEADVIVGNIGSSQRSKYAVVGSGVNMASRIESYTVGGDVLISETVHQAAADMLRIDGQRDVLPKGAEAPVRIYEVGGIAGNYNVALKDEHVLLAKLAREIPLRYATLEGKDVGHGDLPGSVVRLSRSTAEIRLSSMPEPMSNLKMNLRDVDDSLAVRNLYGKVIRATGTGATIYLLHFTSVPPEVDAYFQACLRYSDEAGEPPSHRL